MNKLILFLLLFIFSFPVTARKSSNIYKSSISNIDLKIPKDATATQTITAVRGCIAGMSDWVDAFLKQTDDVLEGSFNYDNKVNILGIGFSVSATSARKYADDRCLKALKEEGLNQVGIYSKYLKINTRNGYIIYAILRTPVIGGFKKSDFSPSQESVDDLFK